MNDDLDKNPLWGVLVETAHSLPLYKSHKNYVQEVILSEKPDIKPEELSERLNMPLGEALVILEELSRESPAKKD
ncbi:MAG: hypothetical protein NTV61_09710 [Candidatus Bathyarchaeota archaeon]|nr:hypothetical protein [Candidatus Bathyarchaeota archaeon]